MWPGVNIFRPAQGGHAVYVDGLSAGSGQELHNTCYITQSPEFGPLKRFLTSAVKQLQRAFDDMPVPSRQPPSTDTPLLGSVRAGVDYNDLSDEDTVTADSPADSTHADTGATTSLPPVAPVVDIPARRLFLILASPAPDCCPA